MKNCTKCKENKSLKEFRKRKTSKDGLSHWCKSCCYLNHSLWEKNKKNRDKEKIDKENIKKQNKKRCTGKCKQIKDLDQFSFRKDSKDGLRGHCKECVTERSVRVHKENKEKRNADSRIYYYKNKEILAPKYAANRAANREKNALYARKHYRENRESILEEKSDYIQRNLFKIIAKNVKRYASQKKRILRSLTKEDFIKIDEFYDMASKRSKDTGIVHHVDHIVPMQGENVSGLHVPWNLQILTASENSKKGNKFDFTYENESWRQSMN